MRLKSELYSKEQKELSSKIISILDLDPQEHCTTLYELDNDKEKQKQIMELVPELRKYFSYACIKGLREPEKLKRPYLSIIKHITKNSLSTYLIDEEYIESIKDKIYFVGVSENIREDFQKLVDKISKDLGIDIVSNLKHYNRSKKEKIVLTKENRVFIRNRYKRDYNCIEKLLNP